MALLDIHQLHKSFGALEVLKGVDLSVEAGQTVAILGASGSGKSTLLRCINALELPDGGSVTIDGELIGFHVVDGHGVRRLKESQMARQRQHVGMVFQHFNLFPHWTALRNVADASHSVLGKSRREADQIAMVLLDRVGLGDRAGSYPRQMSGGQQQRVAIARALAMSPRLMLFDEPTSALDPANVSEVTDVMSALAAEGSTMIVVTHELGFARAAADRVVFMAEGTVVEEGPTADVLDHPKDPETREFLRLTEHHDPVSSTTPATDGWQQEHPPEVVDVLQRR